MLLWLVSIALERTRVSGGMDGRNIQSSKVIFTFWLVCISSQQLQSYFFHFSQKDCNINYHVEYSKSHLLYASKLTTCYLFFLIFEKFVSQCTRYLTCHEHFLMIFGKFQSTVWSSYTPFIVGTLYLAQKNTNFRSPNPYFLCKKCVTKNF